MASDLAETASGTASDTTSTADPRWIALHVHYAPAHQDRLLTEAVAPAVERLRADGLVDLFFFLRYGQGGDHVRLRLRLADGRTSHRDDITAQLERTLRAWVDEHPSPEPPLAPGRAGHGAGGVHQSWNHDVDPHVDARPNNSVWRAAYHPEHTRYGGPERIEIAERHFDASSRLALDLVAGSPPAERVDLAFRLVVRFVRLFDGAEDPHQLLLSGRDFWLRNLFSSDRREELLEDFEREFQSRPEHWIEARRAALDDEIDRADLDRRWHELWTTVDRELFSDPDAFEDTYRRFLRLGTLHLFLTRIGLSQSEEARLFHLALRARDPAASVGDLATTRSFPWRLVRVFVYERSKDRLLLDTLAPLLDELRRDGSIERGFVERDWYRGPNLMLHLRPAVEADADEVSARAAQRLRAAVAEQPPADEIDRDELARRSKELAWWEMKKDPGAHGDWAANGSVHEEIDAPRADLWGGPTSLARAWDYFGDLSPLLFGWLGATRDQPSTRLSIALQLMLATGWVLDPTLESSHLSYRSHAEAFFAWAKKQDLRSAFEAMYQRQKQSLVDGARRLQTRLDAGDAPDLDGLGAYVERTRTLYSEAREDLEGARAELLTADAMRERFVAERGEPAPDFQGMIEDAGNEFHQLLQSDRWQQMMDRDPRFKSLRFVINVLYSVLHQLGVSALDRYKLCYLVARTVEDLRDIDSLAAVRAFAGDAPAGRAQSETARADA